MTDTRTELPIAVIADDEDLGRILLSEAAASVGFRPIAVADGASAVECALADTASIVLVDVDMPRMDGFSVCRRLREESRYALVPIVIVTGHDDSAAIARAFEAGATDFISKPVNWALLPHRLEYIIHNARQVQRLAERESQVRTLLEALPDRLWVVTADAKAVWSPQPVMSEQIGSADGRSLNSPVSVTPLAHRRRLIESIGLTAVDGVQRKLDYRESSSGKLDSYELRIARREGGDVVVVRRDTTELTAAAQHIEQLAYFDQLTGLPNRQRCLEIGAQYIAETVPGDSVAIIYLDLNGFKRINDAFGHAAGDTVLMKVSHALTKVVDGFKRDDATIMLSRFGGDEFVVLLRGAEVRGLAIQVAETCYTALKDPINHEGLEFHATASVGLAVYPDDGSDVATVLKHADTAMHHAKTTSATAVAVYTAAMSSRLRDWLDLEARLRRAVREDGLTLHYQPKFRLVDNQIVGVEALLRWCDAEYGEVPPTRFIAIAEESGLILDLGGWVVREACRQIRAWSDRGLFMPIAINVSARELLHGNPAKLLEAEARAAGISPASIEIEITESLLVADSVVVRGALEKFRSLGCRIALDDFGTGYSSLAYITRFPPDRIKIDRAFVHNVDTSASDAAIANAILSLGESLNVLVTAEGIERQGQLDWMRRRGCHEGQGFIFSRPMSASRLEQQFILPTSSPEVKRSELS